MTTLLESPLPTDATPRTVAVACRGVIKDFGTGCSSELTLLVGPSGCGKTTLISLIAGLLNPTAGTISLFGKSPAELTGRKLVAFRAESVGFVFQQYNLLPALTATENIAVPLLIQGKSRATAMKQARATLELVELGNRADQFPAQLSGGQQQRVAIARSLVHEPKLLVCDEPTAALDGKSGQTVMELIKKVAVQSGRAVIVVTHDQRVYRYGDRIIEMADGRVVRIIEDPASFHEQSATEESAEHADQPVLS
jgi:putative ABC transport system ATP-binding protein